MCLIERLRQFRGPWPNLALKGTPHARGFAGAMGRPLAWYR